jgi:hypothetical protein
MNGHCSVSKTLAVEGIRPQSTAQPDQAGDGGGAEQWSEWSEWSEWPEKPPPKGRSLSGILGIDPQNVGIGRPIEHQGARAGPAGDLDGRFGELDVVKHVGIGVVDVAEGADVLKAAKRDEMGPPGCGFAVEHQHPAGRLADNVSLEGVAHP